MGLAAVAAAQRLPTDVHPSHYDLAFSVDLPHARFDGTEQIQVTLDRPSRQIVLNAAQIDFKQTTITANGAAQPAAVSLNADRQTATLVVPDELPAGEARIDIQFTGVLNDELRGFYLSRGNGRNYAVTQFEATDARRAFPCFDEPTFKATFAVALTIDDGDTAISNGRIVSDTPGPGANRHTIRFATSPKMSSYLVAMAVGDFECGEGAADGIPIRVCALPGKKNLTRLAVQAAEHILSFYDTYFAVKYPYGKLDMLAVPDFAAGAMENTAAIVYREIDLLADPDTASLTQRKNIASVVAHEMAHQWFGDLVTMAWWDDIWLNEGFATWMANQPLAQWRPEWDVPVDEQSEDQTALRLDALESTHPIHVDVETNAQIDEAFDSIVYEKGASVLRMVESYVGRDDFRAGVNAYLQAHAYGNATSADFWNAIANASGKPADRILESFVSQPGAPLLDVTLACESGRTNVTIAQERFASDAAAHWEIPVCLRTAGRSEPTCRVLTEPRTTIDAGPGCATWVFANANGRGYFRSAYPPAMLTALAPRLEDALTAPERLSLVADEWALVQEGTHDAGTYLTLASGYGREPVSGVLDEVSARLGFISQYLTTPADAPAFAAFVRSLVAPLRDELGLQPGAGDTDARRALRASMVAVLGGPGDDPDVAAWARRSLMAALNGTGSAGGIDPTLQATVVSIAAAHGDAALFDALEAADAKATAPDVHYRYLYALTQFSDPALVDRALARLLGNQIRTQDTRLYLARFFGNPSARDRAWAFTKAHWSELEPKLSVFEGASGLVGALGAFCDAGASTDIAAFFSAHPQPAAARTLKQTLERIDRCVAIRAGQTQPVAQWLANR
jgi:aminopeptidase N